MKRTLIFCGALLASTLLLTGCVYHSCGSSCMSGKRCAKKRCVPPQQNNCEEVESVTIEAVAIPDNAPAAQTTPAQPAAPAPAAK